MLSLELLEGLERHPEMYGVAKGSYDSLVTYLLGLDQGSGGGALAGFQELVDLKFGQPNPVHWSGLVPQLDPPLESTADRLTRLFELLVEYLSIDSGMHGRRRLYHEWVVMAQGADHYRPELERFGMSPEPVTMSIDEAASGLGTDRGRVMRLIRDRKLRVGRLGGEVRVLKNSFERLLSADDAETGSEDTR